jgi:hypothetical protein
MFVTSAFCVDRNRIFTEIFTKMRRKYLVFERRTSIFSSFFLAGPEEAGHSDQVRGQETDHQARESQQSGTVSSY